MIFDKTLRYFDTAAFDAASAVVDLGINDSGKGEPLNIWIGTAGNAAGAGAVTVALQTSASSTGTYATEVTINLLAAAELDDGVQFSVPNGTVLRYSKLVVTGITAGTINAGVVMDSQSAK